MTQPQSSCATDDSVSVDTMPSSTIPVPSDVPSGTHNFSEIICRGPCVVVNGNSVGRVPPLDATLHGSTIPYGSGSRHNYRGVYIGDESMVQNGNIIGTGRRLEGHDFRIVVAEGRCVVRNGDFETVEQLKGELIELAEMEGLLIGRA